MKIFLIKTQINSKSFFFVINSRTRKNWKNGYINISVEYIEHYIKAPKNYYSGWK